MIMDKEENLTEFHYYNNDGVFIGKSEGSKPQPDLFDQAYYVFDNNNDIIKNRDLLAIANRKLDNLRRRLLGVPIQDINRIMEINQEISDLEGNIERLAQQEAKPLNKPSVL